MEAFTLAGATAGWGNGVLSARTHDTSLPDVCSPNQGQTSFVLKSDCRLKSCICKGTRELTVFAFSITRFSTNVSKGSRKPAMGHIPPRSLGHCQTKATSLGPNGVETHAVQNKDSLGG
eukprot:4268323-Amphidinium_carterae.1